MISLVAARSGNLYLVKHRKNGKQFTVLNRIKIIKEWSSGRMQIGNSLMFASNRGWQLHFKIVKSYKSIQQAISDNFTEIL